MGISYTQIAMVGFMTDGEDIKKVIPEEFVMEKRFDPKTGEPTADEKVITKPEETTYCILGLEDDYLSELSDKVYSKFYGKSRISSFYEHETDMCIFGISLGGHGLLEESFTAVEFENLTVEAMELLGRERSDIGIHFLPSIG